MTAECSVGGGTEHSAAESAESFLTQHANCSVAGGTEHFVAGSVESFGDAFLIVSTHCHASFLCAPPLSCKWGNTVPMNTFLQPA